MLFSFYSSSLSQGPTSPRPAIHYSLPMVALTRVRAPMRAPHLPPLLRVDQAADVAEHAPVRALPPLGGVSAAALPADELAAAAERDGRGPGDHTGPRRHGGLGRRR
jgi:hypothetical protein